jgi:hypothetical protein
MQDDKSASQGLVAAWRLCFVGMTWTDNGERTGIYGPDPDGYMVLEPSGHIVTTVDYAWNPP